MAASAKKSTSAADVWLVDGVPKATGKVQERVSGNVLPPEPPAENVGPETQQWLAIPNPPAVVAAAPRRQRTNGASKAAAHAEKVIDEQRGEIEQLQGRIADLESDLAKAHEAAEKAPPPAKRPGSRSRIPAKLEKAEKQLAERDEEIAKLAEKVRDLQSDLRGRAKELEAELAEKFQEREEKLRKEFAAREAELADRIEKLDAELAGAKQRAPARPARRSSTPRKGTTRSREKAPARGKQTARRNGSLDLNGATFEELRGLGLSVTQSARMIAYRDVRGGYKDLDELDAVPGLSEKTRTELKTKLRLDG